MAQEHTYDVHAHAHATNALRGLRTEGTRKKEKKNKQTQGK